MSLFPTIITKEILKRNVTLISFVGKIAIVITKSRMGEAECIALAFEEKCDDLVGATSGG